MNRTLKWFWQMLLSLCAFLFLFSVSTKSFAHECPVLDPDRRICEEYHAFLAEIRHDADAVRCVVHQCTTLSLHDRNVWRHKAYYADCYNAHLQRKQRDDYHPALHPPSVDELHCNQSRTLHLQEPYRREIFGIYDTPDPFPSATPPNRLANLDGGSENEGATTAAAPTNKTPVTVGDLAELRSQQSGYRMRMLQDQQSASKPPSGPRPAESLPVATERPRPRINCLPPNVSVVSIAGNGDLTLYNDTGADFMQYAHCFPGYKLAFDEMVEANNAASIIVYHKVHSDRPLNRTRIVIAPQRNHMKRNEWRMPASEFYKEFITQNKGKQFGIALQGRQRLQLLAKNDTTSDLPPAVEAPNKPASKDGGARLQPLTKNPVRYAAANPSVTLSAASRAIHSANVTSTTVRTDQSSDHSIASVERSFARTDRKPFLSHPYGKRAITKNTELRVENSEFNTASLEHHQAIDHPRRCTLYVVRCTNSADDLAVSSNRESVRHAQAVEPIDNKSFLLSESVSSHSVSTVSVCTPYRSLHSEYASNHQMPSLFQSKRTFPFVFT